MAGPPLPASRRAWRRRQRLLRARRRLVEEAQVAEMASGSAARRSSFEPRRFSVAGFYCLRVGGAWRGRQDRGARERLAMVADGWSAARHRRDSEGTERGGAIQAVQAKGRPALGSRTARACPGSLPPGLRELQQAWSPHRASSGYWDGKRQERDGGRCEEGRNFVQASSRRCSQRSSPRGLRGSPRPQGVRPVLECGLPDSARVGDPRRGLPRRQARGCCLGVAGTQRGRSRSAEERRSDLAKSAR